MVSEPRKTINRSFEATDFSQIKHNDTQLSLIDLFYFTTIFSVILGCYSFISQSASIVICGGLAVYLVLRFVPCQFGVMGGMLAFGASVFCMPLMLRFGDFSALSGILLCLVFPSTAYVLGAIYTEFRELNG